MWFFLILGVLTTGGIATNVWFNLHQQLTPEQLDEARRLWGEEEPAGYRLDYTIKREVNPDLAGTVPQNYSVQVRDKKIIDITTPEGQALKPSEAEFDSMDSLFAAMDRQLREDSDPARPRAFVKAEFDGKDGHVTHYVHSVMRTRERLEVTVKMTRESN
jgi:hypothetical protein